MLSACSVVEEASLVLDVVSVKQVSIMLGLVSVIVALVQECWGPTAASAIWESSEPTSICQLNV